MDGASHQSRVRSKIDDGLNTALMHYALEEFQCDQKLSVTGELDSATRAKLKELHGL